MDKYICLNCNYTFDEPYELHTRHGFRYGPAEHLFCCPVCGGDYAELTYCELCGAAIPLSESYEYDGMTVCSMCAAIELRAKLEERYDRYDRGEHDA